MKKRLSFIPFLLLFISTLQAQDSVLVSSDLPIIVINTDNSYIVDEPKTGADMGIIYNGENQRNFMTDPFNHYDGRIGIELRGQSSQFFWDKKSYGIETRDANGDNLNIEILGMPKENDWILYAPNTDKTMVRNTLIYQLSNEVGMYASRTRFVELVFNGEYLGVYVLMEKIKRDKNRVDVEKLTSDEIGEDMTGGYILRLDKYNTILDSSLFYSAFASAEAPMRYQVVYPKQYNISDEQFDYIQNWMFNFERNLTSREFNDPEFGVHNYIDYASFVDYLLLNELARNPDAYRISTYFYKKNNENGGKLHMGPIWGFNIAMGNANFCIGSSPEGWVLNYNLTCPEDPWQVGYWWDRLLTEEQFLQQVKDRWTELRATTFSVAHIHQIIDEQTAQLAEAQPRNEAKWDVIGNWLWPNDFIGETYEDEVDFLKDWFAERIEWMDENMEDIGLQIKGGTSYTRYKMYPNPFSDFLKFDFMIEGFPSVQFILYNSVGQRVYVMDIEVTEGVNYQFELPRNVVQSLNSGMYFYQFVYEDEVKRTGKLIKQ